MTTLKLFRIIAFLEGVSYILLLGIGTPIKHFTGNDVLVKSLGMPHGVLFITYVIFAFIIRESENWDWKTLFIVQICSILPFGTFYVEWKYLRESKN